MERIEKIKEFVKKNFNEYDCGIYFTPNILGDRVDILDRIDGVDIYGQVYYGYFEVFGLNAEEENELLEYYKELREDYLAPLPYHRH